MAGEMRVGWLVLERYMAVVVVVVEKERGNRVTLKSTICRFSKGGRTAHDVGDQGRLSVFPLAQRSHHHARLTTALFTTTTTICLQESVPTF